MVIIEWNLHGSRHFNVRGKLRIRILIDLDFGVPHLEATNGDLVPKLVYSLAGALEAALEPLRFLVGGHNPPLSLKGLVLLLLPGPFRLLNCQMGNHQLVRGDRQLLPQLPTLLDGLA